MTIAVDLGLMALGTTDAASPPAGDGAAAGTGAELANLFQSLVDDLSATAGLAPTPSTDVPAGNGRPKKPGGQEASGVDASSADNSGDADVSASLGALLGLSPLPALIDFTAVPAKTDAPDAAVPQATAGAGETPADVRQASEFVDTAILDDEGASAAATPGPSALEAFAEQAVPESAALSAATPAPAAAADSADQVPSRAQQPEPPARTENTDAPIARSVAGKALARALSALMETTAETTSRGSNAPVRAAAAPTQGTSSLSIDPGASGDSSAGAPAPAAASAGALDRGQTGVGQGSDRVPIGVAPGSPTYSLGVSTRAAEGRTDQQTAVAGGQTPALAADLVSRSVQSAPPSSKAAVDIDVDANVIKLRQSALAFQAPMATDGMQVLATQGRQQTSIEIASPLVMAETTEAGTVADQIVKAIRIQVRDGIGEVRLSLRPEHLGEVQISLKVDRDRVSALLQVERPEVRAQIESQTQTLRAGLAAQGLYLEELTVRDDGQGGDRSQRGKQDTPGRRRRKSTDKQFDLEDLG